MDSTGVCTATRGLHGGNRRGRGPERAAGRASFRGGERGHVPGFADRIPLQERRGKRSHIVLAEQTPIINRALGKHRCVARPMLN
jgi:hypothetical protein